MTFPDSPNGLYEKIFNREGVTGLLLFILTMFVITIIYQGQKNNNAVLVEIRDLSRQSAIKDAETADILKDIRYALRENGGLVFRSNASLQP